MEIINMDILFVLYKAPCQRTQHCLMLHVASVCTPCWMLLRVVAQSLKPVKHFFCSVIAEA